MKFRIISRIFLCSCAFSCALAVNAQEDLGTSAVPFYSGNKNTASKVYRCGILSIENSIGRTIQYDYRWGNGEWKRKTLSDSYHTEHWWNYKGNNYDSPTFYLRYFNGNKEVEVELRRNRSIDASYENARKYLFKRTSSGKIALYEI